MTYLHVFEPKKKRRNNNKRAHFKQFSSNKIALHWFNCQNDKKNLLTTIKLFVFFLSLPLFSVYSYAPDKKHILVRHVSLIKMIAMRAIFGFLLFYVQKSYHGQIGNINDHFSRNWQWINDICTINRFFLLLFEIDAETTYRYTFDWMEFNCTRCANVRVYMHLKESMNNSISLKFTMSPRLRPCCVTDSKLHLNTQSHWYVFTWNICGMFGLWFDLISI